MTQRAAALEVGWRSQRNDSEGDGDISLQKAAQQNTSRQKWAVAKLYSKRETTKIIISTT